MTFLSYIIHHFDLAPGTSERCGVSVVICTRDRPPQLKLCLEYLQPQHSPPTEMIVVDNASVSDETRRVAEVFGARYVRENRPGLDVARRFRLSLLPHASQPNSNIYRK